MIGACEEEKLSGAGISNRKYFSISVKRTGKYWFATFSKNELELVKGRSARARVLRIRRFQSVFFFGRNHVIHSCWIMLTCYLLCGIHLQFILALFNCYFVFYYKLNIYYAHSSSRWNARLNAKMIEKFFGSMAENPSFWALHEM